MNWRVVGAVLAGALGLGSLTACAPGGSHHSAADAILATAVRPLANDCSAGRVSFTFDDGPDANTPAVVTQLRRLHLKATFFVLGEKAATATGRDMIRAEAAAGFRVQVHGWNHVSFTGASTQTTALTPDAVREQLVSTVRAIVATGVPRPTLYRPPYGDVSATDDAVAQGVGLRVVMPWGTATGNIVDSRDWDHSRVARIVGIVTRGFYDASDRRFHPGIRDRSIVLMHDGEFGTTERSLTALQPIVDFMNAHHLCSTDHIRPDATGGVVPVPPPPVPTTGNLVINAGLHRMAHNAVPTCFEHAGSNKARNSARWSRVVSATAPGVRVHVTRWAGGDRKLVIDQRSAHASCAPRATPGKRYALWVRYRGSWSDVAPTSVGLVSYYRTGSGTASSPYVWRYWQSGPGVAASAGWTTAYLATAAVPSGASAVSFGLGIRGTGILEIGAFTLVAR